MTVFQSIIIFLMYAAFIIALRHVLLYYMKRRAKEKLPKEENKTIQDIGAEAAAQLLMEDSPVLLNTAEELRCIVVEGRCPDCQSTGKFLEGPSGGLATNIMCDECKSRFNLTPFGVERL